MTPQEAREILHQIRMQKCVTECDYSCKLYESETFCLEEKALDMAIKALEQTRWIPVSEPPKKNGEYLVTLIDEDSNGDDIFVIDKAYWTGMNWTYKFLIVENVIAYKTLPEPYKESEEEK